jgi:hypothetical protein
VVAAGALPAAAAAGPALGPAAAVARPLALVWGNGVFVQRTAFVGWLHEHHQSYRGWKKLHPAGVAILAAAEHGPLLRPASSEAPKAAAFVPPVETPSRSSALSIVLLVVGLLLAAIGSLPVPVVAGYSRRAALLAAHRIWLIGIGAGLLLGALASKLAA